MSSLSKKMKGSLGAALRKKSGIGITGASGKKFQGSTQYTGRTIGASGPKTTGSASPSSPELIDPRIGPRRIPSRGMGPARTPLSR